MQDENENASDGHAVRWQRGEGGKGVAVVIEGEPKDADGWEVFVLMQLDREGKPRDRFDKVYDEQFYLLKDDAEQELALLDPRIARSYAVVQCRISMVKQT